MLDLKKLRSNTEEVKKALSNRGEDFDVNVIDEVIALDEERRNKEMKYQLKFQREKKLEKTLQK